MDATNKIIWTVIPFYNNIDTIIEMARRTHMQMGNLLLVDDGSTDLDDASAKELQTLGVLLRHEHNRGKGAAILTAANYLHRLEVDYMITLDGDGQHYPEDIPLFVEKLTKEDDLLVVGVRDFNSPNIGQGSRKGRKIANFWFKIETGQNCLDCQSGFRAYPVQALTKLHFFSHRYNFETEALTKCIWGKLKLVQLPIRVFYPPPKERISHFRPWRDNLLISLMHMHLVLCRLLPWKPIDLRRNAPEQFPNFFRHPLLFCKALLNENATPGGLAMATVVGTIFGVIPFVFFQQIIIIYITVKLDLNKVMALAIHKLYTPPFAPFVCIQCGYYLRNGEFWTDLTLATVRDNWQYLLGDWFVGSLLVAPIFAIIAGMTIWGIATMVKATRKALS